MKNRLEGFNPDGRINRENEEWYGRKARAEIETLRYYFDNEWFDDHAINKLYQRNRTNIMHSKYSIKKCSKCLRRWNYYLDRSKKKLVEYWPIFKNIPAIEKKCPECN